MPVVDCEMCVGSKSIFNKIMGTLWGEIYGGNVVPTLPYS